jgi:hypothetical protein
MLPLRHGAVCSSASHPGWRCCCRCCAGSAAASSAAAAVEAQAVQEAAAHSRKEPLKICQSCKDAGLKPMSIARAVPVTGAKCKRKLREDGEGDGAASAGASGGAGAPAESAAGGAGGGGDGSESDNDSSNSSDDSDAAGGGGVDNVQIPWGDILFSVPASSSSSLRSGRARRTTVLMDADDDLSQIRRRGRGRGGRVGAAGGAAAAAAARADAADGGDVAMMGAASGQGADGRTGTSRGGGLGRGNSRGRGGSSGGAKRARLGHRYYRLLLKLQVGSGGWKRADGLTGGRCTETQAYLAVPADLADAYKKRSAKRPELRARSSASWPGPGSVRCSRAQRKLCPRRPRGQAWEIRSCSQ